MCFNVKLYNLLNGSFVSELVTVILSGVFYFWYCRNSDNLLAAKRFTLAVYVNPCVFTRLMFQCKL